MSESIVLYRDDGGKGRQRLYNKPPDLAYWKPLISFEVSEWKSRSQTI